MRHNPASGAIVIMLRSLKMHGTAQAVGELTGQTPAAFEAAIPVLSQLLKAETAQREVTSTAYQLKTARFPAYRDLNGFDFTSSEINEALVRQLHRGTDARSRSRPTPNGPERKASIRGPGRSAWSIRDGFWSARSRCRPCRRAASRQSGAQLDHRRTRTRNWCLTLRTCSAFHAPDRLSVYAISHEMARATRGAAACRRAGQGRNDRAGGRLRVRGGVQSGLQEAHGRLACRVARRSAQIAGGRRDGLKRPSPQAGSKLRSRLGK